MEISESMNGMKGDEWNEGMDAMNETNEVKGTKKWMHNMDGMHEWMHEMNAWTHERMTLMPACTSERNEHERNECMKWNETKIIWMKACNAWNARMAWLNG